MALKADYRYSKHFFINHFLYIYICLKSFEYEFPAMYNFILIQFFLIIITLLSKK